MALSWSWLSSRGLGVVAEGCGALPIVQPTDLHLPAWIFLALRLGPTMVAVETVP